MRRLIAAGVAVLILGLILAGIDRAALWDAVRSPEPWPLFAALLLFIPQILIMSHRWQLLASRFAPMGRGEAIGMILAGQSMNVVLPSKMGDLMKAYFLKRKGAMELAPAGNLVIFEKMLDVAALSLLAVAGVIAALTAGLETNDTARFRALAISTGLLCAGFLCLVLVLYFIPPGRLPFYSRLLKFLESRPRLSRAHRLAATSHEVMSTLQRRGAARARICFLSVILWALHLFQIGLFFLTLGAPVPVLAFCSLMPMAIFVGLLPISLFGMGTRDAAIIFLFSSFHGPAVLEGVALYFSLRYLIPALAGLPFLHHYLGWTRGEKDSA